MGRARRRDSSASQGPLSDREQVSSDAAVALPPGRGKRIRALGREVIVDVHRLGNAVALGLLLMMLAACGETPKTTSSGIPSTTAAGRITTSTPSSGSGAALQKFTPITPTTWWAVVDGSYNGTWVVRTIDSGQHWQNVWSNPSESLASSYFLNSEDGWVVGSVEQGTTNPPEPVYRTLNGGQSWQQLPSVANGCQLDFVDMLHGWCELIGGALGSSTVNLYRTSDGGLTWTLVSQTAPYNGPGTTPDGLPYGCGKGISFTSSTVGWASSFCNGGSPYLYRSTDGGGQWNALMTVPLPPGAPMPDGEDLSAPVVAGPDVALTMGIGGRPGAFAIATSSDDGATWTSRLVPASTPPVSPQVGSVDLIDPTHWRVTNGTVLMATDDGGAHWRSWPSPVSMKGALGAFDTLDFLSPLVGWAVPGVNGGPMWWTTDGGISWKPVTVVAGPYRVPAS